MTLFDVYSGVYGPDMWPRRKKERERQREIEREEEKIVLAPRN